MIRSKMKPEVIDRHVAELREHLERLSRLTAFAAGAPVTVPSIVPSPDDLIEEPVFAVGDLVKTSTGLLREVTGRVSIHEVIEVIDAKHLCVKTKDLLSGWESRFDPSQLTATGRSLVPRAPERQFRE